MKKLVDLNPAFYMAGGEGVTDKDGNPIPERHGIGIVFDCPCGCSEIVGLPFRNPLDGGPVHSPNQASWQRTGDTFETLTLTPSILRMGGCGWHGFLTNGEFKAC